MLNSLPAATNAPLPWKRPPSVPGGCELRLDLWQGPLPITLPAEMGPAIVTDRGGKLDPFRERSRHRDELCRHCKGWLDVDPETDEPAPEDLPWILSKHLKEDDRAAITAAVAEAQSQGALAAKVVFPAQTSLKRRIEILEEAQRSPFPCVAFALSDHNHADRLWAREMGQPWGYAMADQDKLPMKGMLTLSELQNRYRWCEDSAPQNRYLIIGKDVRHSLSPDFHNQLFFEQGLQQRFYPWSTDDPLEDFNGASKLDVSGYAITAPYKSLVTDFGQGVTDSCGTFTAWNTLARINEDWRGTSTDGAGAVELLRSHLKPGVKVVILGRGGAAQSVATEFSEYGAEVVLLCRPGRDVEGNSSGPASFQIHRESDDPDLIETAEVLINATGTDPINATDWPWDLDRFRGKIALEMDYSRGTTAFEKFLRDGKGISVWSGHHFFAAQAVHQAKFFGSQTLDLNEAIALVDQCLQRRNKCNYPS